MREVFTYRKPKAFYDEGGGPLGEDRYFIEGFGGKRQYFNSEDEYNAFVQKDQEKKYRAFKQYARETKGMFKKNQNSSLFGGL